MANVFTDRYGYLRVGWIFAIIAGIAAVVLAVVFAIVIAIMIPVGRTTCKNWSKQTGIESKFTRLNFFDTGTCLAKAPDGRWVKNTSVIINIPKGR